MASNNNLNNNLNNNEKNTDFTLSSNLNDASNAAEDNNEWTFSIGGADNYKGGMMMSAGHQQQHVAIGGQGHLNSKGMMQGGLQMGQQSAKANLVPKYTTSEVKAEVSSRVKSRCNVSNMNSSCLTPYYSYVNELNSLMVSTDLSLEEIRLEIFSILQKNYGEVELEQESKSNNLEIRANLFMKHENISFRINCWKEEKVNKQVRVEFKRMSGSSVTFHNFYRQMQTKLKEHFKNVSERTLNDDNVFETCRSSLDNISLTPTSTQDAESFSALPDFDDLPDIPDFEDNICPYTMEEIGTMDTDPQFLNETNLELIDALDKYKNDNVSQNIVGSNTLINKIILHIQNHKKDIHTIRSSLILLSNLDSQSQIQLIKNFNILQQINPHLIQHQSLLLRKHYIKFLYSLVSNNSSFAWHNSIKDNNNLKNSLNALKNSPSFTSNSICNPNMLNTVLKSFTNN